ncbi:hypothetical protein Arcpr_0738 [Archaeoglobus profundus DSM 5631]|uniref:Uncharacterized protein n=1 Tax=Archaeoglobus profundus (strain DSM 5631 / JCM 9629 / NBRC 100127 / Av18) TaxID=572546 RepID=D2RHM7_ARCPA|nr:hypothetical protein Arcpr_0738 [Archaeoglobus profundus DSM 5631]
MEEVYFQCDTYGYVFLENPYKFPIKCPQCGSEDVVRI